MESTLTYLLKQLKPAKRDQLIAALGTSQSTYYDKRANPGRFTYDEAIIIKKHLDRWHKKDHNMAELLKPMKLADAVAA